MESRPGKGRDEREECKGCGLCIEACRQGPSTRGHLNHYGYHPANTWAGCTGCASVSLSAPSPANHGSEVVCSRGCLRPQGEKRCGNNCQGNEAIVKAASWRAAGVYGYPITPRAKIAEARRSICRRPAACSCSRE